MRRLKGMEEVEVLGGVGNSGGVGLTKVDHVALVVTVAG